MYEHFGFHRNPFFTDPLGPTQEDLAKFVGRRTDIQEFLTQIAGTEGCVHLVTGKPGVGKTSFVNVLQYVTSFDTPDKVLTSAKHSPFRLVPNLQKIQINSEDSTQSLMLKVASSLVFSIIQYCKSHKDHVPQDISKANAHLNELIISKSTSGGSISLAGFGGGVSGGSEGRAPAHSMTSSHLSQLISTIMEKAKEALNVNGAYVLINNLDIVDRNVLLRILNELRDELFAIKSLWIILIGPQGTYQSIREDPSGGRIAETLRGTETFLEAMSEDEAWSILGMRAKIFSFDEAKPSTLPLSENIVRQLYRNCNGEIRFLFKTCDQIIRTVVAQYPSLPKIDDDMAFEAMKPIIQKETSIDKLKGRKLKLLAKLAKHPLRPKDYKVIGFSKAADFTNAARDLISRGLVTKRAEGKAVVYEPTGATMLAVFSGLLEIQE